MSLKRKKVFVAMSGGVDSSVAAALLKRQGYEVRGIFMKNWSENINWDKNGLAFKTTLCPWIEDQEDMRQVCSKLNIPFYTFDFEKEYKEKVVNYFFESYQKGITPNPDVMCNKEIKFKIFLEKSIKLGADFIATGHYARIKTSGKNRYHLLKGKDLNKDQSYFLYTLDQAKLSRILFPIGAYQKHRVRAIAKQLGLTTHDKKDSQGICFIGEINVRNFLKTRIKEKIGKIITSDGKIIGKHNGVAFYTIGQRKGIKIGGGIPYYVVAKDIKSNTLMVAKGNQDSCLYRDKLIASNLSWIVSQPTYPFKCLTKIRYRQSDQAATIYYLKEDQIAVHFELPQRAITPGQSIVFYQGSEVIGGGIIQ